MVLTSLALLVTLSFPFHSSFHFSEAANPAGSCEIRVTPQFHDPDSCVECHESSFVDRNLLRLASLAYKVSGKVYDLEARNASLSDILEIVSITPTGSAAMKRILPKVRSGEIKVAPFTSKVQEKLGVKIAVAAYDPTVKTIYLNRSHRLGDLALFFYHEAVHALDSAGHSTLPATARQYADAGDHAARVGPASPEWGVAEARLREAAAMHSGARFLFERKAYDADTRWLREAAERFPCYRSYQARLRDKTGKPPSDDWINRTYSGGYAPVKRIRAIRSQAQTENPNGLD